MRMSQTFTLAHLSDVHLAPVVGFSVAHWRVKRLLGYVNWHRRRKRVHLRPVVERLVADLKRAKLVFYTAMEMANREEMLKRDIPLDSQRAF